MTEVGAKERVTQKRVIALFRGLGYQYLADWSDRAGNSNIEEKLLQAYLAQAGYAPEFVERALHQLRVAAQVGKGPQASLYEPNRKVYQLLRYGAKVKLSESQPSETVAFIDWGDPAANHFAIAEEVTLEGDHQRRPDLILLCL